MIKSGDILLIRTKSIIGTLIRFFQNLFGEKCPYNHIAIIAKDKGVYYVYESIASGFVRTPYTMWNTRNKEFIIIRPKFDFNTEKVEILCNELVGTKYDFLGTLWVQLIQQITDERLNIGTNNQEKAKKRLYCSEAIAYIFNKASKHIMYVNWMLTDPQDIYEDYKINKLYEKL
jgi:hypothetical protein